MHAMVGLDTGGVAKESTDPILDTNSEPQRKKHETFAYYIWNHLDMLQYDLYPRMVSI